MIPFLPFALQDLCQSQLRTLEHRRRPGLISFAGARQSKINKLYFITIPNDNIGGLDIPMQNTCFVNEIDGLEQIENYLVDALRIKLDYLLVGQADELVQGDAADILHNYYHKIWISSGKKDFQKLRYVLPVFLLRQLLQNGSFSVSLLQS